MEPSWGLGKTVQGRGGHRVQLQGLRAAGSLSEASPPAYSRAARKAGVRGVPEAEPLSKGDLAQREQDYGEGTWQPEATLGHLQQAPKCSRPWVPSVPTQALPRSTLGQFSQDRARPGPSGSGQDLPRHHQAASAGHPALLGGDSGASVPQQHAVVLEALLCWSPVKVPSCTREPKRLQPPGLGCLEP